MGKRVTIQDIADSLGISRNTVSKALNNTGVLADSTRIKILEKAKEMGYKQFLYTSAQEVPSEAPIREIALFTQNMPNSSHFASQMLNTFQEKISKEHFKLSIFLIREQEIADLRLPLGFDAEKCAAVICIELFDPTYGRLLNDLNIPVLYIDAAAGIDFSQYRADFLLRENSESIYNLTNTFLKGGCKSFAFAGDIYNCQSFYERYCGFCKALQDADLSPATTLFQTKRAFLNSQSLCDIITSLDKLPEVFICANDFIAIDLMRALKKCSYRIPDDVLVCGFDDSKESKIVDPPLTTVRIPSAEMGIIAADLLLSRINMPTLPYRTTYVRTDIKYRVSAVPPSFPE